MIFWLFMALAAACGALALRLAQGADRPTWACVSVLVAAALAGYVLSRTTGLPGATDDVGDWGNPLGLAALALEAALLPLAVTRAWAGGVRARPVQRLGASPTADVGTAPLW